MLLLVTLHSVAVAVFLFEWIVDRVFNKSKNIYAFKYIDNAFKSEPLKVIIYL